MLMVGNCPWTMEWKIRKAVDYGRTNEAMERWVEETAAYHEEYADVKKEYGKVMLTSTMMNQDPPPPPDFLPPPQPPKEMDIAFQGPVLRLSSIFNYVQEQHPNDDFSSLRIGRSWRTTPYLKKLAKPQKDGYVLYENLDKVTPNSSEDRESDNDGEHMLKMALGIEMPHGKDKNMMLEQHGTFELSGAHGDKGVYEDYIVTLAGDQLVRCEPSPMYSGRPQLNNARLIKMHGDPYGTGIIEKALDEQDSANAIHNQNIDAVNAVIQPEYEVVENLLSDLDMKPSGPGVRHMVDQAGAINAIAKNFQGIPLGFASLEAAIRRHERITGAVDTGSGSSESATRTARNTNIIAGKLGQHVIALEDELINESLTIAFEMNAQLLTEEQIISVTQDGRLKTIKIDPSAISRGWMVYSAGSKHLAEQEQRINQMLMAGQMIDARGATGRPSPVREAEFWTLMMKEILGAVGPNLVMSQEEFQALLDQFEQKQIEAQIREAELSAAGSQNQAGAGAGANPAGGGTGAP